MTTINNSGVKFSINGKINITVQDKDGNTKAEHSQDNLVTKKLYEFAAKGWNPYSILNAADNYFSFLALSEADITPSPEVQLSDILNDSSNQFQINKNEHLKSRVDQITELNYIQYNKSRNSLKFGFTNKFSKDFSHHSDGFFRIRDWDGKKSSIDLKSLSLCLWTFPNTTNPYLTFSQVVTNNDNYTVPLTCVRLKDSQGTPISITVTNQDIFTMYYTFEIEVIFEDTSTDSGQEMVIPYDSTEERTYKISKKINWLDIIDKTKPTSEDKVNLNNRELRDLFIKIYDSIILNNVESYISLLKYDDNTSYFPAGFTTFGGNNWYQYKIFTPSFFSSYGWANKDKSGKVSREQVHLESEKCYEYTYTYRYCQEAIKWLMEKNTLCEQHKVLERHGLRTAIWINSFISDRSQPPKNSLQSSLLKNIKTIVPDGDDDSKENTQLVDDNRSFQEWGNYSYLGFIIENKEDPNKPLYIDKKYELELTFKSRIYYDIP